MEIIKQGRCMGLTFEFIDLSSGPGVATLYASGVIHFESDDGVILTTHAFRADIVWDGPELPGTPLDEDAKVLAIGKRSKN